MTHHWICASPVIKDLSELYNSPAKCKHKYSCRTFFFVLTICFVRKDTQELVLASQL